MNKRLLQSCMCLVAGIVGLILNTHSVQSQGYRHTIPDETRISQGFLGYGKISFDKPAINSDELLKITCRLAYPGHVYIGVFRDLYWDTVGAGRCEVTMGDKDTAEVHFVVKLHKWEGRSFPERISAGVYVSVFPFYGTLAQGWSCTREVTILDAKELTEKARLKGVKDSLLSASRNKLFKEYRNAHPTHEPFTKDWLEAWKKYILEHENNDSTAIYNTWGIPVFPRGDEDKGKKENKKQDGSSLYKPEDTPTGQRWTCSTNLKFTDLQGTLV